MKKKYPSKTTMNLAMRERSGIKLGVLLPVAVALALVVAAFTKFAVFDMLDKVNKAEAAANLAQQQLDAVSGLMTDYDEVRAEYLRITGAMSAGEDSAADRVAVIDLVDSVLMSKVGVSSFSVTDNTVSVSLIGVELGSLSQLIDALEQNELVASVNVYTAGTTVDETGGAAVSMTIELKGGGAGA